MKLPETVSYPVLPDRTPVVPKLPPPDTNTSPFKVVSVLADPIDTVPPAVCAVAIEISPAPNVAPITILPVETFEPIVNAVFPAVVSATALNVVPNIL